MKFEKREITLNEYDSVQDLLFAHERLVFAYLECLQAFTRKELRTALKQRLTEVIGDIFYLQDLLQSIRNEQA